jgi:putative membrane protein
VAIAILLAGLHYLALGLGLGGVFMRGRYLRALRALPSDRSRLAPLFAADNVWGAAAALWIATGLARLFGGVEKQTDFYLHNGMFWVKMGLFAGVFALEVWPMITFLRWRMAHKRGARLPQLDRIGGLILVDDLQTACVLLLPFVAAAMARGLWLF